MTNRWRQMGARAKPALKMGGKFVLLTALNYGPAGVAGWAVKSVARRPLKLLLALALEPLLKRLAQRISRSLKAKPSQP